MIKKVFKVNAFPLFMSKGFVVKVQVLKQQNWE